MHSKCTAAPRPSVNDPPLSRRLSEQRKVLLIGSQNDPLCIRIGAFLERHGRNFLIIDNALIHPVRFSWHLDNRQSSSQIAIGGHSPIGEDEIASVFVRPPSPARPSGWDSADWSYVRMETHAALLGWLSSLGCPVINRYSPLLWHYPWLSLLNWHCLLWRCGIPALESLISNVERDLRVFGKHCGGTAVLAPLTARASYTVSNAADWANLAKLLQRLPVHVVSPDELTRVACIVGDHILWEDTPPTNARELEHKLLRFAAASGLSFFEITIAFATGGSRTVSVNPFPGLNRFTEGSKEEVASRLGDLLVSKSHSAAYSIDAVRRLP